MSVFHVLKTTQDLNSWAKYDGEPACQGAVNLGLREGATAESLVLADLLA